MVVLMLVVDGVVLILVVDGDADTGAGSGW